MADFGNWNIDAGSFIKKFAGDLQFDAMIVFEDEAIRMIGATIESTPIGLDTGQVFVDGDPMFVTKGGRLRANWQIARKPNTRIIKRPNKSKGRGFAQKKIRGKFATVDLKGIRKVSNKSMFFFNNSPYARVVEFGGYPSPVKNGTFNFRTGRFEKRSQGGFSKQAPVGMLRININRMRNRLRKRVAAL